MVAPVLGTTLDIYAIFCGMVCLGMGINTMYLKTDEHSFYFPLFFAVFCIGVAAISTYITHTVALTDETEDHLYVEN